MKAEGIVCKTRRRFKTTTNSRHNKPVADNTLDRDFQREQPNQAYVGDITYVATREGWLYLSVFIDVCSRAVVGWSMSDRMTATLVQTRWKWRCGSVDRWQACWFIVIGGASTPQIVINSFSATMVLYVA